MTLTESVAHELDELPANKSCCRKALLCGLLFGCTESGDKEYRALFYRRADAERAADIIDASFPSAEVTRISNASRGGHSCFSLSVKSKALCKVFSDIDNGRKGSLSDAIGFRCPECRGQLLHGIFLSCASLSKPKSGYHLEFSLPSERRAELLADILSENVAEPCRITRGKRFCLYYKSNVKISDLLYFFGAARASFDVTNIAIERDIRNTENRATNCVTCNISRSVGAARRYIEAIEYIIERGKLEALGEELEYTARLRLENASASLAELARLHQPPISKSGLNGRMAKILSFAQALKNNGEQ